MELFIEPQQGLTYELLHWVKYDMKINRLCLALFSGPQDQYTVYTYKSIIIIATGFGIAATPTLSQTANSWLQHLQGSQLLGLFGLAAAEYW